MYLLDANTYIHAKNLYYSFDFCPAYWDWLDKECAVGKLASIDMVANELIAGDDELVTWVKDRPGHFLRCDDAETQSLVGAIAQDLMQGHYNQQNRDDFLAGADPWIIAKAKVIGATVVSHESRITQQGKKVKVPNVCQQYGVECISTFELLRKLKARFTL
ncbi:DUF4411 family protein [Paenalcaligenes hominis]|uniref:DUF4411 family protein n=1 Tax=Paenalcaligenes hominis TaxID=643674 RepID=UPI003526B7AD